MRANVHLTYYNSRRNIRRPLRLVAQDTGFSSQQQGFDSPRGRHLRIDFSSESSLFIS